MPRAPKKIYNMPEKIPEGTILADKLKQSFRVGPSIGIGGFGEVYTACKVGEKNYDYVAKCEPSENGPLFVENHFYTRFGKETDIQNYKKKQGLKSFGMPHYVSSGSVTIKEKNHRFLIMPRFGQNLEHYFLANGKKFPTGTVYRLCLQMLDVFEYVHQCGYIHGDLKATNMLLGLGKNGNAQAYLVDFGLAAKYHTEKDFKPDPKKAHNGTMEFESRDAHEGVQTMRSDMEILGYNLINWIGAELPWVRDKLLTTPVKVHAAKVQFMKNLDAELKKLFPDGVPAPLIEYLKYVNKLKHNEKPDYKKCRKMFQDALKTLKIPDSGDLELELKKSNKTNAVTKRTAKTKQTAAAAVEEMDVDTAANNASEDDDDDVIFEPSPRKKVAKPRTLKTTKVRSPAKASVSAPNNKTPSPLRAKRISPRNAAANKDTSPARKKLKATPPTTSNQRGTDKRRTPLSARANINFSPAISISKTKTPSLATRNGSTIVNDNVTPNPRSDKTYEFNFELDVSMDANVIVNVKRKKKAPTVETSSSSKATPQTSQSLRNGTPSKPVRVQKVNEDNEEHGSSPRTPIVKVVKKVKRGA